LIDPMAAAAGPDAPARRPTFGRLRRRPEFTAAAAGPRAHGPLLTLQMRRREDEAAPRLGLTVTKRIGNAVERNRIRRRLRAAAAAVVPVAGRPGHDYVIIARRALLQAAFPRLVADLSQAFGRVHKGKAGGAAAR
jgi:ribonuclease P protein component